MEIKVLGTGCCSKCATLTRNAEDAVKAMGVNATVEEITDIEKIGLAYFKDRVELCR